MSTAVFGAPEFKASNGLVVKPAANGGVEVGQPGYRDYTPPAATFALEEFFQAKGDGDCGRWRYPLEPDYVVYPNPDEAFERMFGPNLDLVVLRESDGMTKGYVRAEDQGGAPLEHRVGHILAARAYFEAHPERKPWEAASEGEIWALTFEMGATSAWVRGDGYWHLPENREAKLHLGHSIAEGRRIWPVTIDLVAEAPERISSQAGLASIRGGL